MLFRYLVLLMLLFHQSSAMAAELSLFVPRASHFWERLGQFAEAAARDIDIKLRIYNAENSPQTMLDQVTQAAQQGTDGILFLNYAGIGEAILKIAEQHKIPALLIDSALDNPALIPRVQYPHWIGSIIPDDRDAGVRLITRLIERARQRGASRFNVLAYTGAPESRAHARRFEGLKSVTDARSDIHLVGTLANTRDVAQARQEYQQQITAHPEINIVWSYSDKFAVAAAQVDAARSAEKTRVYGGFDWSPDALQSLQQGISDFNIGGHIFDGAQGVIMLNDYLKGFDFADERLQWNSTMVTARRDNIAIIRKELGDPALIDYRQLSKVTNRHRLQYRFELDALPLKQSSIPLSKAEQQWIDQHPEITIGVDGQWPPIDFFDDNGQFQGITAEYIDIISQQTGILFNPQKSSHFKVMLKKVMDGTLKVGASISYKKERAEKLYFSKPFYQVNKVILVRKDVTDIHDINDLRAKTVAVEDGFLTMRQLQQRYPQIRLMPVNSTLAALQKVSWGKADAYIGNQAVADWLMTKNQITNLNIVGDPGLGSGPQNFAVSKTAPDWQPLISIINKVLDHMSPLQKKAIESRWLGQVKNPPLKRPALNLSTQERDWLQHQSQIRLGVDRAWRPLEYIDEKGRYQGLSSAYMHYLHDTTGLTFEAPQSYAWTEVLDKLKSREIDVAPMISVTEKRKEYLNFSNPYITLPLVIFSRREDTLLNGLDDLQGKKIAIIKGYSANNFLQQDYPWIERVPVTSVKQGLDALSTGKVDAYIDVLAVGGYQIAAGGYTNLQIAATTPYQLGFSIGVRKDWPILVNIINKALGSISEQQKNEFLHQWLTVRYEQKTDFTIAFWILGFSIFILLLFTWRGRVLSRANAKLTEANTRVEESSRFKSQFLANMSHEIRTPMNAIVGLGHLLSRTRPTEAQSDYIRKLQKSAQTLLGLIDDILDVSKIEAGRLHIERIDFNLEKLLNDLAEVAQLRLSGKDIEFIYDIEHDAPSWLLGDPFRLNQILTNLVSNAIKFTDHGNVLLRVCVLSRSAEQVMLKFSVIDNGIGIAADKLETLFQPFVQEDGSTTRRYGGTGLGLSISIQLTELMHGEMKVDSTQGEGSRFHCILPFDLPDITGDNFLLNPPTPDLHGLDVLLVDDNPQTLEILQHSLHSMTFNVVTASSGKQALSILQGKPHFDLVLLDWRMPGMDGAATAAAIRQQTPSQHLPIIIMMTAYGREAAEQNIAERAMVDGFLVKPVTPSQLFDAIMLAQRAIHPATADEKPAAAVALTRLQGRVLLAEDNEINQQVAAEILQQMGLEVEICENGIEVIDALPRVHPDLILMDIQMPLMDGYQATRKIRQRPEYAELPIIAMTANAMTEDIDKSLRSGMNAHISKPVDPEYLYHTLKQYLTAHNPSPSAQNHSEHEEHKPWPQQVAGLNIAQGIKQVGGNEKLYQKLLSDFLRHYQQLPQTLRQHLSRGEIDSADILMHTIKGVCANIGATALMQIASQINDEIHQQQQVAEASLEQLDQVCKALFDSLQQLLNASQNSTAKIDVANTAQIINSAQLNEIKQLLQHSDARASQYLQQYSPALIAALGDDVVKKIRQLIDDYEFESALQLLEQALQENTKNGSDRT